MRRGGYRLIKKAIVVATQTICGICRFGRIIEVIEKDKRGYKAVQIGFGNVKTSKISKAIKGFFSKKNTEPKKKLKEFRVKNTENFKPGNELGLEIFKDVKFVDIKSKTIGKDLQVS